MVDKVNVELDEAFLKKFFGITERVIPEDQEITMAMLRQQLEEIAGALKEAKKAASEVKPVASKPSPQPVPVTNDFFGGESNEGLNLPKKQMLIIDDLGVITYQLEVLFKQHNFDIVTSKEIYDAIEKFKKQSFDLVIMDLFIPTEREGFILLEELKKIAASKQTSVKIGVMSASPKKEHKQLCKMKGAEFYIEKADDWQKDLLKSIANLVK